MRSSMQHVLFSLACFVFTSADDFWSVDEDTLPESLPGIMRGNQQVYFSDNDIEKAVFWAYKVQNDVVSEHNGHVFDTEPPLSHFENWLILPKIRVSSTDSDVVFENNTITGLADHKNNEVVIKWSQNQVSSKITWNELQIAGKYTFLDNVHYTVGKYFIVIENLMYQADTPLSANIELYPSSAPNAAMSYSKFRTVFTGKHTAFDEFFTTRYFLEEVAFRYVADHAMATMRGNVTFAIRAAVQPYVLYKNRSDPHFPGAQGQLDDSREFVVSDPFTNGLDNAVQKVRAVGTVPDAGALIVYAENTLHNLSGTFDLFVRKRRDGAAGQDGENANVTTSVGFAIDRVRLSIAYDVLRPNCYCSTAVQVYGTTTRPKGRGDGHGVNESGLYRQATEAFVNSVKEHLSTGTCRAIVKMNRFGRNPFCPLLSPP